MQSLKIPKVALYMGLLGIVSGLICSYLPEAVMDFAIFDTPVFHGVIFGAVIGFGQLRWGNGGVAGFVIILVVTTLAWIAAVNGFNFISQGAKTFLYPAAMISGSIGAAGTLLGAALANSIFRNLKLWLLTIFAGALTGILVVLEVDSINEDFLVLFVVWQSTIALCFGLALNNGPLENIKR